MCQLSPAGRRCWLQSAASLADAAPGRFVMGVGSSSNVIVERWNDIPFEQPYQKCRDVIRFLKASLGGEKVTETYDTFDIKGFRLDLVPDVAPPIVLAALREGMLRLAGREAEGAITNWLSAEDAVKVSRHRPRCRPRRMTTASRPSARSWPGSSSAPAPTPTR